MLEHTYRAKRFDEAIEMVKRELGPDAVILSTRTVPTGLLGGKSEVELRAVTHAVATEQGLLRDRKEPRPGANNPSGGDRISRALLREGVSASASRALSRRLATLGTPDAATLGSIRSALSRAIEREIAFGEGLGRSARVVAMVGPTGVGKTTTIAKLAAALKLRHAKKVGLVTSDTYRIAAVEQLRTYANIIGLPLKIAHSPEDMAAACESHADCDVILVDTAGRSQHDADRLDELRRQRDAAQPHQTHLVLAANACESVLLRAAERFRALQPDRLLITKLDEAVAFGPVVNVATRIGLGLSFVTTGQEVPDHIERARAERLARMVLDGGVGR